MVSLISRSLIFSKFQGTGILIRYIVDEMALIPFPANLLLFPELVKYKTAVLLNVQRQIPSTFYEK